MVSKSYIRQLIFDLTPYFDPFTAHDETYSSYFACNKGSTMYIIILQSQYEIIQAFLDMVFLIFLMVLSDLRNIHPNDPVMTLFL